MIESLGYDEMTDDTVSNMLIPVQNICGPTLAKVIEWMEHHCDDPEPYVDEDEDEDQLRTDDISKWD